MSLLLDTHALLWWLADSPELSRTARDSIATDAVIVVSAASLWEISIKRALGKLVAPASILDDLRAEGFAELGVSAEHALHAGGLPAHHRDPFDRMLVAQAQLEGHILVTRDQQIHPYAVQTLW